MNSDRSRLIIRMVAVAAGLGLLLAACGDDSADGDAGAATDTSAAGGGGDCPTEVCMEGIAYTVTDVRASAGDDVTWTNLDGVAHTVTAGTPEAPNPEAADSGNIEEGGNYEATFPGAGEFPFYCTIHPQMQGTVTVE
jgi:plastocyanin